MPTPAQAPLEKQFDVLLRVSGTVQGVGFRPFVARLANRFGIRGWVCNDQDGVLIRVNATGALLTKFRRALDAESPPASRLVSIAALPVASAEMLPRVDGSFVILESAPAVGARHAAVTPDLALCPDCRRELLDATNRRFGYPFINCTNCGPRYSIIRELPYDRPRTTMAAFTMCPACRGEYENPLDRRYHAQPNACPECGPQLTLLDAHGRAIAWRGAALAAAVAELRAGRIVAAKGVGGFHLLVDATNEAAVRELRVRKHREEKPLAVMFRSVADLREHALVDAAAEALLQSPAAPIVLSRRRQDSRLAASVAPNNPWIGALLPYTPLHVLLLERFAGPVVATSANLSEEPLCVDNNEAVSRLAGIADVFLVHDREIARPVDDSVVRCAVSGPILLRRARGYAPTPFRLPRAEGCAISPTLCVGGHLKSTVAITNGENLVLSPHIGDLENPAAFSVFRKTIDLLLALHGTRCEQVVCDAHPDYASTGYARKLGLRVIKVQHHLAHVLACLLEHDGGPERVLGVAWDGTGYGDDKTIWGGEFILVDRVNRLARRVAHLLPFRLPGGEAAVREPRRSALGALHAAGIATHGEMFRAEARRFGFRESEAATLADVLGRGMLSPVTTSAGRLFDAVAAVLGLGQRNSYEGQAAMAVEFAADDASGETAALPWTLQPPTAGTGAMIVDWTPALLELRDLRETRTIGVPNLSMRWHRTLADSIAAVARATGIEHVVLTGGCFQNVILTELACEALRESGFTVLLHRNLPPNDNAIAAGQALGALWGITSTSG